MKLFCIFFLFLLQSCEEPKQIEAPKEEQIFYKAKCYSNGVLIFEKDNFVNYGYSDNGFFFYDKSSRLTNISGDCVVEEQ